MKLPNLKNKPSNKESVFDLTTKEAFAELIWKHHGIITLVCAELDINYPQFYKAVRRWKLEEELKKAKETFISEAEATIYEAMKSKSEGTRLKAADMVLKYSTPKQTQEITVKTGDTETTVKNIFGIE